MNSDPVSRPVYAVFGAAGGIGSELCRRLAARGGPGTRLLLVGRTGEKLSALAESLTSGYPACEVVTHTADVTQSIQVDAAIAAAVGAFGRLDGVAHSVGSILLKAAHLTSDEDFATTLAVNLQSAFYVLRASVKAMMANPAGDLGAPGGSIVLVSTVAARIGLTNHEAIAAAKAGVQGLTLSAAATYAPRNIRVNCVAPGLVKTPLAARITGNEAALKASVAMHPMGRVGEPADVAAPMAWLLDPATTWVTGQIIGVDGGLGSVRAK